MVIMEEERRIMRKRMFDTEGQKKKAKGNAVLGNSKNSTTKFVRFRLIKQRRCQILRWILIAWAGKLSL